MSQAPTEAGMRASAHVAPNDYYHSMLFDCFEVIRSASPDHQEELLQMIRQRTPLHRIRGYLDRILPSTHHREAPSSNKKIKHEMDTEDDAAQHRPQIMDIHYLCGNAPFKVPAKPWTKVTDDDDLVSHLVSLYMTWDYPFFAFFDREIFLEHMSKGILNSDFCSPFLVNALLANACDYSQYSETYAIPGDVRTKGAAFLAEAESYMSAYSFERGSGTRLASLQATLLLYERYSVLGNENFGYAMLNRAIEMAEELGIVNRPKRTLNSSQMSEDMLVSVKRTAWGLFQIDTIVHTNFLKPTRVHAVSVDRIQTGDPRDEWTPYPISSYAKPSWMALYFDEACNLAYIARDISKSLSTAQQEGIDTQKAKQDMYDRLRQWEMNLPISFRLCERPAPHILLLMMRYHALVINLCCDNFGYYSSFSGSGRTSPIELDADEGYTSTELAVASGRKIAAIAQYLRTEYGISYMHQFAMYAINVALYILLEQPTFDILDPDFFHLASAFSVIANRSPVGRNIYHFFKLSMRSRYRGKTPPVELPPEIRELLIEGVGSPLDQWHQATASEEDSRYMKHLDDNPQAIPPPGLKEMIGEYEKLSVGTEERARGGKEDDFGSFLGHKNE
ncbi:pathway-specific regulatory protein [Penicillium bovifimosum]|uniref:Pathway-specific regulatory protein n=1 Tax=Penicillium bovifimosum TaxID=126998 RepID=A0A9W9HB34_9EURO|nr:pathway-specific regulatory protein [Penicillium bovifimosum]KAJ5143224.1 pathway-specific regulatory protein [Penicillium bovifimosum]